MENIIEATSISEIFVLSDQISKINVQTAKTGQITIKSGIEGETYESLLINTNIENNVLEITSGRTPFYEAIDDKLAAHKVLSIVLELTIPEQLAFSISSDLAAVNLQGFYKYINLNLGQGDCHLYNFHGSGIVNTRSGSISVKTHQTKVEAQSRHGEVAVQNNLSGIYRLKLKSLTGAISVTQSE